MSDSDFIEKNHPNDTKKAPKEVSMPEKISDTQFLDDLKAAIRLKSHLVGRGVAISGDILTAMAKLEEKYS